MMTPTSTAVPKFIPERHLVFKEIPKSTTMQDLGLADNLGVSNTAVTEPFQLFSHEAIQIMRSEIFKDEVHKNHTFSSNLAPTQLRGYAREHAPFTYAAWTHPDTVAIVSKLAGIELIPWGDYEIAHINLSSKSEEQVKEEQSAIRRQRVHADEGIDVSSMENVGPIVDWHTDSYPFVCVLMMSDCMDMVGGETALRTGSNNIIRIRSPNEGCAIVLQGRYIEHQALRAFGTRERITAVTSWRPSSPYVKDDTVLRTVRPVSDLSELYYDFATYRLEMIEHRIRQAREELHARRKAGGKFDTLGHKSLLAEVVAFTQHTNQEIVEEAKVKRGVI